MNRRYIVGGMGILALGAAAVLLMPRRVPLPEQTEKLEVAASFYPLAFFAGEIGGDHAAVATITPAGVEPHDYELTAGDMARIERSGLLILNGAGLEPWGARIRAAINPNKIAVVDISDGFMTEQRSGEGGTIADPHLWLSPVLAQKIADALLQGFVRADPGHRAEYEANAAALAVKLVGLDRSYRDGLRDCAEKNIITSHAAFGYLGAAYGFRQVPIAGLSPDAEPSPAALALIAEFAKKNGVKHIFFERLASPKLAQTLAREIGAQTLTLNPIEGLTGDQISQGKNYFTEMQNNLKNLQLALRCRP